MKYFLLLLAPLGALLVPNDDNLDTITVNQKSCGLKGSATSQAGQ